MVLGGGIISGMERGYVFEECRAGEEPVDLICTDMD